MKVKGQFSVVQNTSGHKVEVSIQGSLTEAALFPEVGVPKDSQEILIDVHAVNFINSGGVRRWITWVWGLERKFPRTRIVFRDLPFLFGKQLVAMTDFLPKNSEVISFGALFFCPRCDLELERKFHLTVDLAPKLNSPNSSLIPKCSNCNGTMNIDQHTTELLSELAKRLQPA